MGGRRVVGSRVARAVLVGVAATLATFTVQYHGPLTLVSNECGPHPAPDCFERVLAAGLPLYWVSDSPWISARNALTPWLEDPVRWWAFGADVAFWGGLAGAASVALRRRRGARA